MAPRARISLRSASRLLLWAAILATAAILLAAVVRP